MTKKTKKAFAIETIVEALKQQGYEKNDITGELVYQGVFDDLGTELVAGLESHGFLKGNLRDYYRYIKEAKDAIYDGPSEQAIALDDPVIASARQLQAKISQDAEQKITAIRDELEAEIAARDMQIKAHQASHDELLKQYEALRAEITSLKATNQNQASELDSQRQYLVKVETENGMLKSQLQDKERQLERETILLKEFKETLSQQYLEKEAKILEEKAVGIAKAEGQANHYATQLHAMTAQCEQVQAELDKERRESQQAQALLNQSRGQVSQLQTAYDALQQNQLAKVNEVLKTDLKVYAAQLDQKVAALGTEAREMPEKIRESMHSLIYRPLNEVLEKLDKLAAKEIALIEE